eukprot:8516966-Prorocentrum_lima.AAC.1
MTSSLVGSEMCIRDRPQEIPRMPRPPRRPHEVAAQAHWRCRLMGGVRDCLLYTSDAADDM